MRSSQWVLVFFSLFTFLAGAATAPAEYWHMTGKEKRTFHVAQGAATPHFFGHPQTIRMACTQGLAFMGLLSKSYMKKTIETGSGYADDIWRRLFGKSVHTFGPMAPGEITLSRPVFDIEPGTYAVTFRFSLASPFLPRVPGGEFRPGLLVIIHRDGHKEDRGIFTMPPTGLTGFAKHTNPFSINFVNHLDLPSESTQRMAALTLGRVVTNVYQQVVSPEFGSVILKSVGPWEQRYEKARGYQFGERLCAMPVGPDAEPMFEIFGYDGKNANVGVGTVSLIGPFVASGHSNGWYVPHGGYEAK